MLALMALSAHALSPSVSLASRALPSAARIHVLDVRAVCLCSAGTGLKEQRTLAPPSVWWINLQAILASLRQSLLTLRAFTHVLSMLGCSLLMGQRKTVEGGIVSQPADRQNGCPRQLRCGMDATGAALLWQSLGAFAGALAPSENTLRHDFTALDADGDGTISAGELQDAVRKAAPSAKSKWVAQTLVDFADIDSDGIFDYSDYRLLRRAAHPTEYMLRYRRRWRP